jgi:hypothetical protein
VAGLDPAIHVEETYPTAPARGVDARIKSGQSDFSDAAVPSPTLSVEEC